MGVVNVTPDSFSDGGQWLEPAAAVEHGLDLLRAGADLLDVGGESTRPGAARPPLDEELRRVLPVVRGLASAGAVVSVDTMRARIAAESLDAGAALVNDVSGGAADPAMLPLLAERGAPCVLMHWRGHSERMAERAVYDDVVSEVRAELLARVESALGAGVARDRIAIDPGLGFAKTAEHNWALLARLDAICALGYPVLVGASRKAFLGRLLAERARVVTEPPERAPDVGMVARDAATAAVSALAAAAGAWCVRVHEVSASRDAVEVAARWRRG